MSIYKREHTVRCMFHLAQIASLAAEFDFGEVMRTGGYIRRNLSSRSILSRMYTLRRTAGLAQARGSLVHKENASGLEIRYAPPVFAM